MSRRLKSVVSAVLALVFVFTYIPLQGLTKVAAAGSTTPELTVSKKVTWNASDRTKADITITSDVPELSDTNVLFIGTLCKSHSLNTDTVSKSIDSIAKNANVYYYMLSEDNNSTSYNMPTGCSGVIMRNTSLSDDQKTNIDHGFKETGNHASIAGFINLLYNLILDPNNKNKINYDYIVFEFDCSRVAATNHLISDTSKDSKVYKLASELDENFYKKNKVIWITDCQIIDGTRNNQHGEAYIPTNYYYSGGVKRLDPAHFKQLCAVFAPDYYLDNYEVKTTNPDPFGIEDSRNRTTKTLDENKYKLEVGVRSVGPDYVNGDNDNDHNYMVYPNTARQLSYSKAAEIADFLYMAIEGVTMKFDDNIKVADNMTVTNVKVDVLRQLPSTETPTPTPTWVDHTNLNLASVTPTGTDGNKYKADKDGVIKVTTGNTDPADNNSIAISVTDVKNQIKKVRVTISLYDPDEFASCIEKKMENGQPVTDDDGNYVYIMNPNDGQADVTAVQKGTSSSGSGTTLGEGHGAADAPVVTTYTVTSTVTNGDQDYDDVNQNGKATTATTTPAALSVVTYRKDTTVFTYTPDTGYGIDTIKIDGAPVTLTSGVASSTTAGSEYSISTDQDGVVTITLPLITKDRSIDVKFKSIAPVLSISKAIVSPSPATVTVAAGDYITYKITVTNSGESAASGVEITDTIDTSLVEYEESDNNGIYDDADTVTWSNLTVAANSSKDLTLKVKVKSNIEATKTIKNTAKGTYNNDDITPSNETSITGKGRDVTFVYNITGAPAGFVTPSPVTETYGSNPTQAGSVAVSVTPPDGYTMSSWCSDSNCTTQMNFTNKITSSNYSISPDDKIQVYAKLTSIKDFSIAKTVTYGNGDAITEPVGPASTVKYKITVTNNNQYAAISNVKVVDAVPEGLIVATPVPDSGSYDATKNEISWTIASIPAGDSVDLTFNASVPGDLKVSKDYKNVATLVSAEGTTINDKKADVTFSAKPDDIVIGVVKTWSDSWTAHPTETVYVRLYRNDQPIAASASSELIELNSTNQSWTGVFPNYDNNGSLYEYEFKEVIPATATTSETAFDAANNMNGRYKVEYSVDTTTGITTISNNYVIKPTDFTFEKVADGAAVPGGTLVYTLNVTNNRPETATNVVVEDILPQGLTFGSLSDSTNAQYDDTENKVTWTIPSVAGNGSASLTITATVDSSFAADPAQIENIANITAVGGTTYTGEEQPSTKALTDVRSFTVTKVWSGTTTTPTSVKVQLMQNSVAYGSPVTITATDGWTYTWTNLPLYNGTDYYLYEVVETPVTGYKDPVYDYSGKNYGNTSATITNTLKTYNISYAFSGSVAPSGVTPPAPTTVDYGTKYDAEPAMSATNYVFDGWYTDSSCSSASKYTNGTTIDDTNAPGGNLILYGKWTDMPVISYQFVGDVPAGQNTPAPTRVVPGYKYNAEATPSEQYYSFTGWCTDVDCMVPYADGTAINVNTELYGKWERKTSQVNHVLVTGDSPDPSEVTYPADTTPNQGDTIPVPSDPVYTGDDYDFDGWFSDPDGNTPYTPTVLGDDPLNIYAKWTKKIQVTYEFLGTVPSGANVPGMDKIRPQTSYDSAVLGATPAGYKFDGWYLDQQMTQKYVDGTVLGTDVKLYGQFRAIDPGTQTGDNSKTTLWATMLLLSVAGFRVLIYLKKKEEFEREQVR